MSHPPHFADPSPEARFARSVTQLLSAGAAELPHDVTERLRAARERAVLGRRRAVVSQLAPETNILLQGNLTAGLGANDGGRGWWQRVVGLLPLAALVLGLYALERAATDERAQEAAAIDAVLLTDELPPQAYADPGFVQYLKLVREEEAPR